VIHNKKKYAKVPSLKRWFCFKI